MILIVSHFTKNKGTTDYFRDFLFYKKMPHYYLCHPFSFVNVKNSQLIYFDGHKETILKEYCKFDNDKLDLVRNFFVSLWVAFKYGGETRKIFAFGSFNALPFLLAKHYFKNKVVFWGVDYSDKRFSSFLMNKLYFLTETISCKFANMVIQPSKRQENIRIQKHGLEKKRSMIISNGVLNLGFSKDFSKYTDTALFYLGSITPQHGVVEFVKHFYVEKNIKIPLYIFGGGEDEEKLKNIIKENKIGNYIEYFGFKNIDETMRFLLTCEKNIFGIAPYNNKEASHVYYADSLKFKEYINLGIPFVTNSNMYIPNNLKQFGLFYDNVNELEQIINNLKECKIIIDRAIIKEYQWFRLFEKIMH